MYRVIRASGDYDVIVLEDIKARDAGRADSFLVLNPYRYACDNQAVVEGRFEDVFNRVEERGIIGYFSGQADGMGFGMTPSEPFADLADVWRWIIEMNTEHWQEMQSLYGVSNEQEMTQSIVDKCAELGIPVEIVSSDDDDITSR